MKTKDQEKGTSESSWKETNVSPTEKTLIWMTADSSSETIRVTGGWHIPQVESGQPRIPYSWEEETEIFSDEGKLRELITCRPTLKNG